ncbi:hypothetical protein EMIHUDRAFT_107895 [Emiliania huxleyi CCMP1516]|uniref:Solute carrier family 40 protein n=2 Tax=Emiliania huxleyi TaxID=2903 RepID=A0A0D3HYF5_EMIH1|nr:hypothetical protein EMIHUDRAFT_107895 [Emiliania huxleyi CCMP1516]EOD04040.1 hypothetical protein EMIHUDRAFT_107895 [Emiliania huxleyi CCMP1516]|eukprot:XP_005756469.1 hypothetical protein EMIHUDRAFT_107895 [Emiliania huxleyi CCMP1516]
MRILPLAATLAVAWLSTLIDAVGRNAELPLFRAAAVCAAPVNRSHPFSGSFHCGSLEGVVRSGQAVEGDLTTVRLLAHVVGGPAFGVLSDRRGRRCAVATSLLLKAVAACLLAAAAAHASREANAPPPPQGVALALWLPAVFVSSSVAGAASAQVPLNALYADHAMSCSAVSERLGPALLLLAAAAATAALSGTALSAALLRMEMGLSGYARLQLVLGVAAPLPALLLLLAPPPASRTSADDGRRHLCAGEAEAVAGASGASGSAAAASAASGGGLLELAAGSRLLQGLCSVLGSFSIATLGWRQGEPRDCPRVADVGGASSQQSARGEQPRRVGPPLPLLQRGRVTRPVFHQAQALVVASCTVALAAAAPCFSRSLFDPSAYGSRAALPFAVGLASVLLALLLAWRTLCAGLLLAPVRNLHHAAAGERGGEMEPLHL